MKKFCIASFVVAFSWALAFGQTNEPRTRVETLLTSLVPGNVELAIDSFAKDSLVPKEVVDSITSQARSIITPERTVLGYEFLEEQNAADSVTRLTYVLKMSDRPLFWNFSFYKPTNDWVPLRMYLSEEP